MIGGRDPALYMIGGGPLGLGTLRVARELGLRLVVTDKNPDAPGMALADESHRVDGGDVEGHLACAEQTEERVVAVLCGAEFGARAVHAVRKQFGLAHNDPQSVNCVLDKEEMKLAFLQEGVPTPQGAVAETAEELLSLMHAAERIIVKPLGGSGSRGVCVVERGDNVRAVLARALASVPDERAVLVEPFLEGRSIDVNGLLVGGVLHPAGILEKFATPLPARLPLGGYDPVDLTPGQVAAAYNLLADAVDAVGLTTGPVKGDFILGPDGFQVLEVGARFHGDVTTAGTLPFGTGIDPVRAYLQWCLGADFRAALQPKGPAQDQLRGYATWRVLALPPGVLERQPEPERLDEHPGIGLVWHRFRRGQRIEPYGDTTKIPGYITAHGRTKAEAEDALRDWFETEPYQVQPDLAHAEWYGRLVEELRRLDFCPACSGVPDGFS